MSFLEAVAGIVVLAWLWHYGARRAAPGLGQTSNLRRLVAGIILCVLAIGLVAAVFGYMRLASRDTRCPGRRGARDGGICMGSGDDGRCCRCFRVWPLRLLHMVQSHRDLLERRIYRLFLWLAVVGWLARYLDYVGLFDPAWSMAEAFSIPGRTRLDQHFRGRHRRLFPHGIGGIPVVGFHPICARGRCVLTDADRDWPILCRLEPA